MNWLDEQYQNERRADEMREAQRQAELDALLEAAKPKSKVKGKSVRRTVGSKLIEFGERLQDNSTLSNPSTSKG